MSSLRRNILGIRGQGSFLPYDAEIEYLESTGTQYINTGFVNTLNTEFEITFQLTDATGDRKIIGQGFKFGLGQINNKWRIVDNQWFQTSVATDTNRHTVYTDNGKYYIDSPLLANRASQKAAGTYPMLLFAVSSQNSVSPDGNCSKMRLYSCKIYDNGALVRDFIPVRVGTEGCLYDKASGHLYENIGTGNFILGNDNTTSEYSEIEYLESTGLQYIDTGIQHSSDVGAQMSFQMTTTYSGDYCLLGIGDDRFRWGFSYYINTSNINYIQISNLSIKESGFNLFENYEVNSLESHGILYNYKNDKNCYVDETLAKSLTYGNLTNGNIWMFGYNYGGDSGDYVGKNTLWRGAKVRIYECKITINDIVVRDYIPVRVYSTGYMLDKVSGQLFGNLGRGSFILGNDVV